jgi:hypothetical protein
MTNHTASRKPAAVLAVIIGLSTLALGACSKSAPASADSPASQQVSAQQTSGSDTVDLVNAAADVPTAGETPDGGDRRGLRARLLRALHATWVTNGKRGPVTHQAIRGDVTAVSATSITVKAKDGFSLSFTVTTDTMVRERVAGSGRATKATASSISAIKVGAKALVTGVGATNPTARVIVHLTPAPAKPSPSATS